MNRELDECPYEINMDEKVYKKEDLLFGSILILIGLLAVLTFMAPIIIRNGISYQNNGCDSQTDICGIGQIIICNVNTTCSNIQNCDLDTKLYVKDNICYTNIKEQYRIFSIGFRILSIGIILCACIAIIFSCITVTIYELHKIHGICSTIVFSILTLFVFLIFLLIGLVL